jgi:hypothetical protein
MPNRARNQSRGGSWIWNLLPIPSLLTTLILPRCTSTAQCEIASPRPNLPPPATSPHPPDEIGRRFALYVRARFPAPRRGSHYRRHCLAGDWSRNGMRSWTSLTRAGRYKPTIHSEREDGARGRRSSIAGAKGCYQQLSSRDSGGDAQTAKIQIAGHRPLWDEATCSFSGEFRSPSV